MSPTAPSSTDRRNDWCCVLVVTLGEGTLKSGVQLITDMGGMSVLWVAGTKPIELFCGTCGSRGIHQLRDSRNRDSFLQRAEAVNHVTASFVQ